MNTRIVLSLVAALTLIVSCGEDSTGPSEPDITPSTLSLAYTGDSSRTVGSSAQYQIPAFSDFRTWRGSKGRSCQITASWTICTETVFKDYTLYRSNRPGISSDPLSADELGIFTDPNDTLFVDNEVNWASVYYYALKTTDTNDYSVWSNEVSIAVPDAVPDSVVATIVVGNQPLGICPLPSGEYVYVTNAGSEDISVISVASNSVIATVSIGYGVEGICSLPSGEYVYVTSPSDDMVFVIRTSDNSLAATLDMDHTSYGICSLPSGEYVYVTGSGNVYVIQTSDYSVVATIDVGTSAWDICALPSGEYVYVTDAYSDHVSVIRTLDNSVVATIDVGERPQGICSLPSGEYVYVTNVDTNNISVIRTLDNTVATTVDVGKYASYVLRITRLLEW